MEAQVPIDVVSRHLVHSTVTITLDIYRTVYWQELQEFALDFSRLLGREGPENRFDTNLSRAAENAAWSLKGKSKNPH